ncbi:MAG: anthranilate synthase component II [Candidatus Xenobia bacterium]
MNVLFIDNFDSFTFNLTDELQKRDCQVEVWRNDIPAARALEIAMALPAPRMLVISPGPGTPAAAGCCIELIRAAAGKVPVFGVCLGHQAMVEAFGGVVSEAGEIVHGKTTPLVHDGSTLFDKVPSPVPVARYHSLVATRVPDELRVTARCGDLVMAVQHTLHPMLGVQFHPESILSPAGGQMLDNLMRWAAHA